MNRTTATCIAGIRRKTASRIRSHFFQVRVRPREAERFPRAFGVGIFATRLLRSFERNPVALNAHRPMLFSQHHQENKL
jgi:hypothetical protein